MFNATTNPHWSLQQYALRLSGSAFTVGMADEEPCNFAVPSAPEHIHVPTVMSGFVHVMPAKPDLAHIMFAKPQLPHVTSAKPGPVHVMLATQESLRKMAATPSPQVPNYTVMSFS